MKQLKRLKDFVAYLGTYHRNLRALRAAQADGSFDALWAFLEASSLAGIMQVRSELDQLLTMLRGERPRTILEIGTAQGGTLLFWAWAAPKDAEIITVDLHHGPFGGGHRRSQGWLYRRFATGRQRIHLVRGDSHATRTWEKVKKLLRGRQADFLFIDGDHSLEGVETDYRLYGPLVRPGGIIAFHDIVPAPYELVGGVPSFWAQMKPSMGGEEIVEDWNQGGYGIGWIGRRG
ncbi:MAG: class I SAM-dependent methyltransferase [Acidobacteriota bacterium]